jgi:hypothetical protein
MLYTFGTPIGKLGLRAEPFPSLRDTDSPYGTDQNWGVSESQSGVTTKANSYIPAG